jgi:UV DNA damage endonuclease
MNLGYPCSNITIDSYASRSFSLASYSADLLLETVGLNLDALMVILEWNLAHDIHYFRLPTTLIPFGSHPVMDADWKHHFADQLATIGAFIVGNNMRITVHPGQYILLNSPSPDVRVQNIADLNHQCDLFDLLGLDNTKDPDPHRRGD